MFAIPPVTLSARLLIVDDEAPITEMLCTNLRRAGYLASGSTSARTALANLQPGQFDLLLTDVSMPEMSGIDLIRAAQGVDPDLACVMITGNTTIDTAVEAMRAGAVDYILKPFRLGVVMPVLARALEVRRLRLENSALTRGLAERAEELKRLNDELEKRVEARTRDLQNSLAQKGVLLREVHHRVRNNLQVIGSLLTMQAECLSAPCCADALLNGYRRVWSMTVIQAEFDGAAAEARVNFGACTKMLCSGLLTAHCGESPRIRIEVEADTIFLPVDQANTCALILNELVSNALKHAFRAERGGEIHVSVRKIGELGVKMAVRDDGQGLAPDFARSKSRTLGLRLVDALVAQLGGKLTLDQNGGTVFGIAWTFSR